MFAIPWVASVVLNSMIQAWWDAFIDIWCFVDEALNGIEDDDGGFHASDGYGFEPRGDFSGGE